MANRISIIRNKRGLKQVELAQRVGIDPSYLSRIESGKRIPDIELALSIATELDTSLDALFLPK